MKRFFILILISMASFLGAEPIKAIAFDFGGVIAVADRERMAEFMTHTLHITTDELRFAIKEMQKTTLTESEDQFWQAYASKKGVKLPEDWQPQFESVIRNSIVAIPGMLELVENLKQAGYQTALLSDMTQIQAKIVNSVGFFTVFNPVLLSFQTGFEKPQPEAYENLLKELSLPSDVVLFIDDKPENVQAAKNLGIDAIWFQNLDQLKSELKERKILS